jgi:GntR family transcriptional regulator of arabinose operon
MVTKIIRNQNKKKIMDNRNKLKYHELSEELRKKILNGEVKPNDKLPSENELSAAYQVSRQTVRKALQILQEEGYIYTEHGRGTFCSDLISHRKKSKNIAVVTTYLSDYIFPTVIQGIDEVLTENGYSILLKNTNNSRNREAKCLEELLQKDIDGLIIEPSKSQIFCKHLNLYAILDEYRIPYVFIQGTYAQLEDKPHILMNDRKGGFLITDYLIQRGHKNIIGIFKADDLQGQERHKGYIEALQHAGIPYDPDKVIWYYTEDRKSHPYEKIRQMTKKRNQEPFDAVVCYNDQIAIQVLKALEEEQIACPDEVAVTGYDNSYLAATCRVPLTTIAHPQERLGKMAAELLLKLIREEPISEQERSILMEPELIIRDSTD